MDAAAADAVEVPPAPDAASSSGAPDASSDAGVAEPDSGAAPDAAAPVDSGAPIDAGMTLTDPPPLKPYSGGTCPTITGGPTDGTSNNTGFMSAGDSRDFKLLVPMSYDPSHPWPLVFAWHWLNASAGSFVRDGELESAINEMGMLVVLPEKLKKANGDKAYLFDWPFVETNNAEKELTMFDDLLTCISQQYSIDARRVYGIGVSAGALWLTYLLSTERVNSLAAVESLSGGLGQVAGVWQIQYTPQPNKFPAVVLWGGPRDWLGVNFAQASQDLRDALIADDHFVVVCTHDQGHAVPPITAPPGSSTRFWSLWRFMLDHPYGTNPSPYEASGLPTGFPDFCSIPPQ